MNARSKCFGSDLVDTHTQSYFIDGGEWDPYLEQDGQQIVGVEVMGDNIYYKMSNFRAQFAKVPEK